MANHPGLFDRIGRGVQTLFGGRTDPRLSQEENRGAASEGLISAGLATLLASGRDGFSPTSLQAIAQGAQAGRAAGRTARETEVMRNQQDELRQLVESGEVGPELLQDMFTRAIVNGDVETMRALSGVLPAIMSASRGAPSRTQIVTRGDPDDESRVITELINLNDGSVVRVLGNAEKSTGSTAALRQYTRLGPDEKRSGVWQIQADGSEKFLGYSESENASGAERINAQLGGTAMNALQLLDTVDEELASVMPTLVIRGGPILSSFANMTLSDDQQAAVTAAAGFINPVVRYLSGAQMTDKEAQRYYRALIPGVGDRARTIQIKSAMRRDIASAMSQGKWQGTARRDERGNIIHDFSNADAWLAQAQLEASAQVGEDGILELVTEPVDGFEDLIPGIRGN